MSPQPQSILKSHRNQQELADDLMEGHDRSVGVQNTSEDEKIRQNQMMSQELRQEMRMKTDEGDMDLLSDENKEQEIAQTQAKNDDLINRADSDFFTSEKDMVDSLEQNLHKVKKVKLMPRSSEVIEASQYEFAYKEFEDKKQQPDDSAEKPYLQVNTNQIMETASHHEESRIGHEDDAEGEGNQSEQMDQDERTDTIGIENIQPSAATRSQGSQRDRIQPSQNERLLSDNTEDSEPHVGFGTSSSAQRIDTHEAPLPTQNEPSLHDEGEASVNEINSENDDAKSNQSFGRNDPIRNITVTEQDADILDFQKAFDIKFGQFKQATLEKYQKIRFEYLQQFDYAIKENQRQNSSKQDYMEDMVAGATAERDEAVTRASQSRIILANVLHTKIHTKRAVFNAWKYQYEWMKYVQAKSKFCDNFYEKKAKQKIMNAWRQVAHEQFLEKAFKIRDEYELQQRVKIYQVDNKIDNLMLYLAQLQQKIEEETGLILEIPDEYQVSINNGLGRIKGKLLLIY